MKAKTRTSADALANPMVGDRWRDSDGATREVTGRKEFNVEYRMAAYGYKVTIYRWRKINEHALLLGGAE